MAEDNKERAASTVRVVFRFCASNSQSGDRRKGRQYGEYLFEWSSNGSIDCPYLPGGRLVADG